MEFFSDNFDKELFRFPVYIVNFNFRSKIAADKGIFTGDFAANEMPFMFPLYYKRTHTQNNWNTVIKMNERLTIEQQQSLIFAFSYFRLIIWLYMMPPVGLVFSLSIFRWFPALCLLKWIEVTLWCVICKWTLCCNRGLCIFFFLRIFSLFPFINSKRRLWLTLTIHVRIETALSLLLDVERTIKRVWFFCWRSLFCMKATIHRRIRNSIHCT